MKVVVHYKGKLRTYNVRNKRQAYGIVVAHYRAVNFDGYWQMLVKLNQGNQNA
jgi:hypothetical protein